MANKIDTEMNVSNSIFDKPNKIYMFLKILLLLLTMNVL